MMGLTGWTTRGKVHLRSVSRSRRKGGMMQLRPPTPASGKPADNRGRRGCVKKDVHPLIRRPDEGADNRKARTSSSGLDAGRREKAQPVLIKERAPSAVRQSSGPDGLSLRGGWTALAPACVQVVEPRSLAPWRVDGACLCLCAGCRAAAGSRTRRTLRVEMEGARERFERGERGGAGGSAGIDGTLSRGSPGHGHIGGRDWRVLETSPRIEIDAWFMSASRIKRFSSLLSPEPAHLPAPNPPANTLKESRKAPDPSCASSDNNPHDFSTSQPSTHPSPPALHMKMNASDTRVLDVQERDVHRATAQSAADCVEQLSGHLAPQHPIWRWWHTRERRSAARRQQGWLLLRPPRRTELGGMLPNSAEAQAQRERCCSPGHVRYRRLPGHSFGAAGYRNLSRGRRRRPPKAKEKRCPYTGFCCFALP